MEINSDNKSKIMAIGTLAGAVIGLGTAITLSRTAAQSKDGRIEINRGDIIKVGTVLVGALRSVSTLGR